MGMSLQPNLVVDAIVRPRFANWTRRAEALQLTAQSVSPLASPRIAGQGLTILHDPGGNQMTKPSKATHPISVEHVRIETAKPFADVRASLEALVPPLNTGFRTSLERGAHAEARNDLEALAELSIFLTRDHGELLRIWGQSHKAVQYEIGNPLTASSMTRYRLAAALYAPLRVVLYEVEDGRTVFEYDLPSSLFGQFGENRVTKVGRKLDRELEEALLTAAS